MKNLPSRQADTAAGIQMSVDTAEEHQAFMILVVKENLVKVVINCVKAMVIRIVMICKIVVESPAVPRFSWIASASSVATWSMPISVVSSRSRFVILRHPEGVIRKSRKTIKPIYLTWIAGSSPAMTKGEKVLGMICTAGGARFVSAMRPAMLRWSLWMTLCFEIWIPGSQPGDDNKKRAGDDK